jgi:hypothetical protein
MIGPAPNPKRRRGWLRIAGTVVSLGLLAWMLSRQDWQAIRALAAGIPGYLLLLALGLAFASQGFSTLRWWILMHYQAIRVGYRMAFRLTSSGMFASNFLPGTIGGDVIRIAGILPSSPSPTVGIASVVVDRGIGVTAMLFVLPLSLATFGPVLVPMLKGTATLSIAAAVSTTPIARFGRRLGDILRPWMAQPQSLVGALVVAGLAIVAYVLCVWCVANGLGMEVTPIQVASVTGITYFLSQIPISFNALGVREAAMIALYVQLGSTPEQAAALALITRALVMLSTVPGAIWLPGSLAAARGRRPEVGE